MEENWEKSEKWKASEGNRDSDRVVSFNGPESMCRAFDLAPLDCNVRFVFFFCIKEVLGSFIYIFV